MDETKLVGFLEAAYALERSDQDWLQEVARAFGELGGPGYNYMGMFYDASDVADLKMWNLCRLQTPPPELERTWNVFRSLTDPAFVRSTFRSLFVGSARKSAAAYLGPLLAERERNGYGDFVYVNSLDPSGVGCVLTQGCREREFSTTAREAALLRRLATHLSSAFRCRRKLASARSESGHASPQVTTGAEAVLDDRGRVVHAEGAAQSSTARARIQKAAASIDSARAKRSAGSRALDRWHPLTSARWTLVDSFQEGGRRYVVARENQAETQSFVQLTNRERQVVVHAALGLSNKQIAYTLGISDATVRVLMARAAGRLGVRSRKQLLQHSALRELVTAAPSTGLRAE
ncbi:MAG TPA: LuxR C-terminal-related transcriptional regulator [Polyangiaceae bacterium]|jgi:DNA-binding CsgD family transcriptional regulator|nr:LuxR C-terminal-related transcriptional regulator [Polyangiaceae bacterium]